MRAKCALVVALFGEMAQAETFSAPRPARVRTGEGWSLYEFVSFHKPTSLASNQWWAVRPSDAF